MLEKNQVADEVSDNDNDGKCIILLHCYLRIRRRASVLIFTNIVMINTQAILDFWFGDIRGGWTADDGKWQLWFGGKSNNDAIIQKRFGTMIDAALAEDENAMH